MTTTEDVRYAYRLLLGRAPEDEAAVKRHQATCSDLQALRAKFMNSHEFRKQVQSITPQARQQPARPPQNSPPMVVELDVPAKKLEALFDKTSAQWHHLGATEPHWSVLTAERFRKAKMGANRAEFYASGFTDCDAFVAALARAGVAPKRSGRLLELGCGVGRVTAHLAKQVGEVVAVDISKAHLHLAEDYAREIRLSNVKFRQLLSIEDLPGFGTFDMFFSVIVLQHNPPPVILRLLRHVLTQLAPGGVAYFQVPTYNVTYRFRIDEYLAQGNTTEMEMHFLPQPVLFDLIETQNCRLLELREDAAVGRPEQSISNTLLVQKRTAARA